MNNKIKIITALALGTSALTITAKEMPYNVYAQPFIAEASTAKGYNDYQVYVPLTYNQTEARKILSYVNSFRTGNDKTFWNSTNTGMLKAPDNLNKLNYDYDLEKVAMQRLAEIAITGTHERPNGTDVQAASDELGYSTVITSVKENLLLNPGAGDENAAKAHADFLEPNDSHKYDRQAHRRMMLNSGFNCMGAAYAKYGKYSVWVEVFGYRKGGSNVSIGAYNTSKNVLVNIGKQFIKDVDFKVSESSIAMKVGSSRNVPSVTVGIRTTQLDGQKNAQGDMWDKYMMVMPVGGSWTSSNSSVASVSGNTIKALKSGSANISVSYLGKTQSIPVTVANYDISTCDIKLSYDSCYYNGKARTPAVTIKEGNTVLTRNKDYAVTFENNTNAGTARMIITGKGNYAGTKTVKNYTILAEAVGKFDVKLNYDSCYYNGKNRTPKITVQNGDKVFKINQDYKTTYKNNLNAGTATVTITGMGNLTKTVTKTFKILPKAIGSVKDLGISYSTCTYTGVPRTPAVRCKTTSLSYGKDFIVEYKNNTNVGTAAMIVTGRGNYTGKTTKIFKINPKSLAGKDIKVKLTYESCPYTGIPRTPAVKITDGDMSLKLGGHFIVQYMNNLNKGTATVVITGIKNYKDVITKTFTIK